MFSLIANKVKNKYVLYPLFMCPTVSDLYNNNHNKNCLCDILLTWLFVIPHTTEMFKHATSHKAD